MLCITQARMTSTRLPGKVLMAAAGRALLGHHLDRLRRCRRVGRVVVATSINAADDPVAAFAESEKVPVIRGSESDVLGRFAAAALAHPGGIVVRATADCPLVDPEVVDAQVAAWQELADPRAVVTIDVAGLPRGLGVEVFARDALLEAAAAATDPHEREHVTSYFYRRPDRFRAVVWTTGRDEGLEPMRWCVDEAADLAFVRRLLEALPPGAGWRDALALLRAHPDWLDLNREVRQKA